MSESRPRRPLFGPAPRVRHNPDGPLGRGLGSVDGFEFEDAAWRSGSDRAAGAPGRCRIEPGDSADTGCRIVGKVSSSGALAASAERGASEPSRVLVSGNPAAEFPQELSWSHDLVLTRVTKETALAFYEIEAARECCRYGSSSGRSARSCSSGSRTTATPRRTAPSADRAPGRDLGRVPGGNRCPKIRDGQGPAGMNRDQVAG